MKRKILVCKIIIIVTGITVALLRTFTDIPIIRMAELCASSFAFLKAYEHKQLKKESNGRFWFYIFAGVFAFIFAIVTIWRHF